MVNHIADMEVCEFCALMTSDVNIYDCQGLSGNNLSKNIAESLFRHFFIMVEWKQFLFGSKLSLIKNKRL